MARINARGQITIPKDIRVELGLDSGVELEFGRYEDGVLVKLAGAPQSLTRKEIHARVERAMGAATNKSMTTGEIVRMFRGDDWGRD